MADVMVIMLEESEDIPGDLLDALLLNLLRKAVGHRGGGGGGEGFCSWQRLSETCCSCDDD